jgi:choline dehydrogenase
MSLPDLQVRMRPGGMYKAESAPAVTASCAWLRPYSAGSVPLRASDPHDPPKKMVATFLTDVRDVPPLIEGIRVIRRIFDEPPFAQPFKGGDSSRHRVPHG